MELEVELIKPSMDLDQLIRRVIQDHYLDIQPPVATWEYIQRHLEIGQKAIAENSKREQCTKNN